MSHFNKKQKRQPWWKSVGFIPLGPNTKFYGNPSDGCRDAVSQIQTFWSVGNKMVDRPTDQWLKVINVDMMAKQVEAFS